MPSRDGLSPTRCKWLGNDVVFTVRVIGRLRGVFRKLPGGSCRMVTARRVRIESDEPQHYQVDGDYGGETPVDIELTSVQHRLLIP